MRKISNKLSVFFLLGLAASALVGCGSKGSAEEAFLFSASTFTGGKTYKLNLKGLKDNTCTLICQQASTPLDLSGTWKFDNNSGYTFDFGSSAKVYAGYNSFTKSFYSNFTLQITSSESVRLMMTHKDESFQPSASYVDPYDAASQVLYKGVLVNGGEDVKLRDFGDGTFDIMSFGETGLFEYGTVSGSDGSKVYKTTAGKEFTQVASTTKPGNFMVDYVQTVAGSGPMAQSKDYHNKLYALAEGVTEDDAFPDPRGVKEYIFEASNLNEYTSGRDTVPVGQVKGHLWLFKKDAEQAYEFVIVQKNGDESLREEGTWEINGKVVTLTSTAANATLTEANLDGFDYVLQIQSRGGRPFSAEEPIIDKIPVGDVTMDNEPGAPGGEQGGQPGGEQGGQPGGEQGGQPGGEQGGQPGGEQGGQPGGGQPGGPGGGQQSGTTVEVNFHFALVTK